MFIELLTKQEHMVTAFDEKLFNILVEKMVIYTKDKVEVHFKNGQVIEIWSGCFYEWNETFILWYNIKD